MLIKSENKNEEIHTIEANGFILFVFNILSSTDIFFIFYLRFNVNRLDFFAYIFLKEFHVFKIFWRQWSTWFSKFSIELSKKQACCMLTQPNIRIGFTKRSFVKSVRFNLKLTNQITKNEWKIRITKNMANINRTVHLRKYKYWNLHLNRIKTSN